MGIGASDIEAGAALAALGLAVYGSVSHFVGKHFKDARTANRVEDAIFGYRDQPGLLTRVTRLETSPREQR